MVRFGTGTYSTTVAHQSVNEATIIRLGWLPGRNFGVEFEVAKKAPVVEGLEGLYRRIRNYESSLGSPQWFHFVFPHFHLALAGPTRDFIKLIGGETVAEKQRGDVTPVLGATRHWLHCCRYQPPENKRNDSLGSLLLRVVCHVDALAKVRVVSRPVDTVHGSENFGLRVMLFVCKVGTQTQETCQRT